MKKTIEFKKRKKNKQIQLYVMYFCCVVNIIEHAVYIITAVLRFAAQKVTLL